MYKLSILVNNKYENVDLDSTFSVNFNYQIKDFEHPSDIKTGFSKTISILGTPHNNDIFSHIYKTDSNYKYFKPNYKTDYYLSYNGLLISTGYIVVNNIDKSGFNLTYKCTLFDTTTKLLYNIKYKEDGTLRTLSDLKLNLIDEDTANYKYDYNYILNNWATHGTIEIPNGAPIQYDYENYLFNYITPIYCNTGLYNNFDSNKFLVQYADTNGNPLNEKTAPVSYKKSTKQYFYQKTPLFNEIFNIDEEKDGETISYKPYYGWSIWEAERDIHPTEAGIIMASHLPLGIELSKTWDIICDNFNIDDSEVHDKVHEICDDTFMLLKNIPEPVDSNKQDIVNSGVSTFDYTIDDLVEDEGINLFSAPFTGKSLNTTINKDKGTKIVIKPKITSSSNDNNEVLFFNEYKEEIYRNPFKFLIQQGPYPPSLYRYQYDEYWNDERRYDISLADSYLLYTIIFLNVYINNELRFIYPICGNGESHYSAQSSLDNIKTNIKNNIRDLVYDYDASKTELKFDFFNIKWNKNTALYNKELIGPSIELTIDPNNFDIFEDYNVSVNTTGTTVLIPKLNAGINPYFKYSLQYRDYISKGSDNQHLLNIGILPDNYTDYNQENGAFRYLNYDGAYSNHWQMYIYPPIYDSGKEYFQQHSVSVLKNNHTYTYDLDISAIKNNSEYIGQQSMAEFFSHHPTQYYYNENFGYRRIYSHAPMFLNGVYLINKGENGNILEEFSINSDVIFNAIGTNIDVTVPNISKDTLNGINVLDTFLNICKLLNINILTDTSEKNSKLKLFFNNNLYLKDNTIDLTNDIDYSSFVVSPNIIKSSTYKYGLQTIESYADKIYLQKNPNFNNNLEVYDYNINQDIIDATDNINFKTGVNYNMNSVFINSNMPEANEVFYNYQYIAPNKGSNFKQTLFWQNEIENKLESKSVDNSGMLYNLPSQIYQVLPNKKDIVYKICMFDNKLDNVEFENCLVSFNGLTNLDYPITLTNDIPAELQLNGKLCYVVYPRRISTSPNKVITDINYPFPDNNMPYTEILQVPLFQNFKMINDKKLVLGYSGLDNTDEYDTLYTEFFSKYNSFILSENNKAVKTKVRLNSYNITDILRRVYYFDDSYWIIQKLNNFDFSKEFNEVEFVQIDYKNFK